MPTPSNDFEGFRAELEAGYPSAFAHSAHLLRRLCGGEDLLTDVALRADHGRIGALSKAALSWPIAARSASAAWQGLGSRIRLADADVLFVHVPARSDYEALLAPIAAELEHRGSRVAHLSLAATWPAAGPATARTARARYAQLVAAEERFASAWRLGPTARHALRAILKTACWDAAVTGQALAMTGARVGLAVHTKLDPGVLSAFKEAGIPLLLIQHGAFSAAWEEHDFLGASLLLAWGPYFCRELERCRGPKPPSVAVGNPRLEPLARARSARGTGSDVVYFGTNFDEDVDTRALRFVASALTGMSRNRVRFRPHPAESLRKYRELVREDLIAPEQVTLSGSAYEDLLGAGLVIGTQSTLLLEAVATGVPAVQVLAEELPVDWGEAGLPHASSPLQLRAAAVEALSDQGGAARLLDAARPLAEEMFLPPAGASVRCARAIERSASGQKPAEHLPVSVESPA